MYFADGQLLTYTRHVYEHSWNFLVYEHSWVPDRDTIPPTPTVFQAADPYSTLFTSNRPRIKSCSRQIARVNFVRFKSSASNCHVPFSKSQNKSIGMLNDIWLLEKIMGYGFGFDLGLKNGISNVLSRILEQDLILWH